MNAILIRPTLYAFQSWTSVDDFLRTGRTNQQPGGQRTNKAYHSATLDSRKVSAK